MFRFIVSLAFTAATLLFAFAPAAAQPEWEVELIGGIGFTRLTGNDTEFMQTVEGQQVGVDIGGTRIGLAAGTLVTVKINRNFGVQSGLVWTRRGGDGEALIPAEFPGFGSFELTADVSGTFDYIDIPVLGVLTFPVNDAISVHTMAGPVFAFNTRAEVAIEISSADFTFEQDIGEETKAVDVGGLLGAGIAIPVGAMNFHADARYGFSFTSIDDTAADLDLKHGGLFILAGLGFPLGR
jgi:hypothetical protein